MRTIFSSPPCKSLPAAKWSKPCPFAFTWSCPGVFSRSNLNIDSFARCEVMDSGDSPWLSSAFGRAPRSRRSFAILLDLSTACISGVLPSSSA
ncbi:hypothetical protein BDV25DRAFT_154681 [Aspergillus avenaceus]|uniref:Uncharacterized protein n=1 Tax=Aspergillus avenaceus TaxID=36643 RepID=A0A5N6TV76_ASPAV|nr:hypothetical protein BDV25DRAFT_154681 [Aspergillus avenaceus]